VCIYGFCNVCVCLCMGFVMSGFVYVWILYCVSLCMYGSCNVWLCECIDFEIYGCGYVWVFSVWVCVGMGFVM